MVSSISTSTRTCGRICSCRRPRAGQVPPERCFPPLLLSGVFKFIFHFTFYMVPYILGLNIVTPSVLRATSHASRAHSTSPTPSSPPRVPCGLCHCPGRDSAGSTHSPPPPQPPAAPHLPSVSVSSPVLDISCKWNPTVSGFLCSLHILTGDRFFWGVRFYLK